MADKKYPKTLSAPVDEDLWAWFTAQAEAQYRTNGAHLRWLIEAHRDEVDQRGERASRFAATVARRMAAVPIERAEEPDDDDPEEGVT